MEEALAALPEVERHARRMVDVRAALLEVEQPASRLAGTVRTNGSSASHGMSRDDADRAAELRTELMQAIDAIEQLGALVKDVDTGLLDFPAVHPDSGDSVLLCWQLGEDTIGYWHEENAGFAGRKPLPFS